MISHILQTSSLLISLGTAAIYFCLMRRWVRACREKDEQIEKLLTDLGKANAERDLLRRELMQANAERDLLRHELMQAMLKSWPA